MWKEFWEKIKNFRAWKWPLIITAIFAVLVLIFWSVNFSINQRYQDIILPKVSIGGHVLSGLNYDQARDLLQKRVDFVSRRGFVYNHALKNVVIYPTVSAIESSDSSYALVLWEIDKSLQDVFAWQQDKSFANLFSKLFTLWQGKNFALKYEWDRAQHELILHDALQGVLSEKKEASFVITGEKLVIEPEQSGQAFDLQSALTETAKQISNLENKEINLQLTSAEPSITETLIKQKELEILALKDKGSLVVLFEELDWEINFSIWSKWLILKNGPSNTYLSFDEELAKKYFELREITKTLERPVQDAKFEVVNGKVKEFLGSQAGLSLDWSKIISDAEIILNQKNIENKISLSLISVEPSITNDNVNDLGIVEIIGTGSSDFTGSPKNRVHNIGIGADSVNGSLIAPGAEFSLLVALGEIDGEHGYLQELVIKGNETKPEYGGGLCQIGTTVFRGALASGLPITARRNHSYRVSYYEPAGTDATIYDPWPDFKFKNDTAKHILIQSRIEGTKVYFDFWGTKDGREIIMTEPQIYNIVAPPEKKIIKTLDLSPGQTKCTERAHNGADAKFDYSVLYPNTTDPVLTTFRSHYVPWQEVCLLGVTQEELDAENSSSTPDEIPLDSEQETVEPILTE